MIPAIDNLPRIPLGYLPTPLVELKRLSKFLNGPRILIKRDDMTGLGLGGNKIRKLEFLFGEAMADHCDTVITGGATQSNHCRQTAAAAATLGIECHLALGGTAPEEPNGNLLLDYLFGAIIHWCGEQRKGETLMEIAEKLKSEGHHPYIIPYGGSNSAGAMGFVAAMNEIKVQLQEKNIQIHHIVFPSSSGGTHAGMTIGAELYHLKTELIGIAIDKRESTEIPYKTELTTLANQLATRLNIDPKVDESKFIIRNQYLGEGYGVVGNLEKEAIRLLAKYEGMLLDPVYSGRAMGGLIDMIRNNEFKRDENVLFWHTGGIPAIFDYAKEII
jgi:D-cysteine desulfhydrase family pyridoxal phosphate-dependent enzyme